MPVNIAFRHPKRTAVFAAFALALLLFVLLSLPIADLVGKLEENGLVRAILNRKRLLVMAAAAFAIVVALWLALRRDYRTLAVCCLIGAPFALVVAVYEFQLRYPYAGILSLDRYGDAVRIVLGRDAALSKFDPVASLTLERRSVTRAAYPAVDVHFHLESLPDSIGPDRLIQAMDAAGIDKIVNLGGTPGGMFEHFAETFYAQYPERIILFAKPDPGALQRDDGIERDLEWIKRAARLGARGLKENKSFGLGQRDAAGDLVPVDDVRLAPIWNLAGDLGMPVIIHTGEPPAFWQPVDVHNERYAELLENPSWSLYGADNPSREALMEQRERLLARHPRTNIIGAHFGMNPDDLAYAARLMDTYPNYYVDMSSVIQELGRQPYSARRFFIRYQDRILFGTDGGYGLVADGEGWTPERMFASHFEFLETDNEYIDYPMADITKQGKWHVYGLDLPDEVLEKIYVGNAEKLIPTHAEVLDRLERME
jgi:predicted TIM-barrel fold metal-dependent hydrolase